jgi:uncharacterized protein YicC (UPF0701 family)
MPLKLSRCVMVLLSCVIVGCFVGDASKAEPREAARPESTTAQPRVNPDAQILADFQKRIEAYMELHNKLEKESPPLKETKDPAKIQASQETMAAKIRAARADAKQGDIFSPEIRTQLRRLMYPETKGREGAQNKAVMKEENNELKDVVLKVNARYPDSAPLMTVAPDILAALPKLPEDLEYRFVNKHMILLDTHANIIVDFVPNAIQ